MPFTLCAFFDFLCIDVVWGVVVCCCSGVSSFVPSMFCIVFGLVYIYCIIYHYYHIEFGIGKLCFCVCNVTGFLAFVVVGNLNLSSETKKNQETIYESLQEQDTAYCLPCMTE